jgi:hypothetical protein
MTIFRNYGEQKTVDRKTDTVNLKSYIEQRYPFGMKAK